MHYFQNKIFSLDLRHLLTFPLIFTLMCIWLLVKKEINQIRESFLEPQKEINDPHKFLNYIHGIKL